ncbi:MAG: AI-2E family transporter [Acidobacteriota bacterium]
MKPRSAPSQPVTIAIVILAIVAVLAAMREAQTIVIPMLVAIFIAVVADSPVSWLQRKGVHRILGIITVITGIVLLLMAFGALAGSSIQELSDRAPTYQEGLRQWLDQTVGLNSSSPIRIDTSALLDEVSPDAAWELAAGLLNGVSNVFRRAFLIIFLVIFILFEIPSLGAKLEYLGGSSGGTWKSIAEGVRRYLAIKSMTSLVTGLLVGVLLALAEIDFALLWGLLAFLLNYIPNIGSLIASVPAVLLALLQQGPGWAVMVAAGYLAINVAIGNLIEPRIMGEGLGLSTLVVFLSLILWGWLLGPVGMLISVPLTASVKIALQAYESTRPIAVLMGATSSFQPSARKKSPPRPDRPVPQSVAAGAESR